MVVVNYALELGNSAALDAFDGITHMAFGDDNTAIDQTQTALISELLRVSLKSKSKDTVNNEHTFIGAVPITQLNSDSIYEIGLFNASSGGLMAARLVLDNAITKTSSEEIVFELKIQVNTENT